MDVDGSADGAARLGLDGFAVLAAAEVDGELHQLVETTAARVGCPACGVVAVCHDRRRVWVRDLPSGGRPVTLCWSKRVWRCADGDCQRGTWTERAVAIAPRASLTERARRDACRRVGRDGHSVAQVARDLGVGWSTVMTAVRDHGTPLVDAPARTADVEALGMDETAFLAGNQHHHTLYVTGFVDLTARRLLDVVPGRSAASVTGWLDTRPGAWLRAVGAVALDPHRGYANGLLAHLGHATVVVDHFHAVQLANAAIDDVCSSRSSGTGAAPVTRSTGSVACCCEAPRPSPSGAPPDWQSGSTPVTATTRSVLPGSPRSCSETSTQPSTPLTPAGSSPSSTSGAPTPRWPR